MKDDRWSPSGEDSINLARNINWVLIVIRKLDRSTGTGTFPEKIRMPLFLFIVLRGASFITEQRSCSVRSFGRIKKDTCLTSTSEHLPHKSSNL